ncbi:hypothetical protein [Microbulbifer thermotolerans]|uniref:Lipoprotein n=1 Tax=Microbulbifer thermotolerans TaxID=252514 RepID=A0A143HKC3_MICTH|nr:hypothetical protein [Microbulbifer thermotolerans]AMX01937.1 hypothetical protein A3224_04465 [Microbulbifer thermotolerans]MCX2796486.1 hypothetical protein [Microbulbifer thermotolerans]MCX2803362.1 hypothetical protein [Microbulbifer thermotolerans]MCX2836485.1 hypothetical protein [Microbulbifer thermotolerans]
MLNGKSVKLVGLLAVFGVSSVSVLGCAQNNAFRKCSFEYTNEIKREVVSPLLKEEVADLFPYFNVEKPAIVSPRGKSKIILSPINRVDGRYAMSEESYVFVFDTCTSELVEHYKAVRN